MPPAEKVGKAKLSVRFPPKQNIFAPAPRPFKLKLDRPFLLLFGLCLLRQAATGQQPLDERAFRSLSPAERCGFIHGLGLEELDSAAFVAVERPMSAIAEAERDHRAAWLLRFYRFQNRGKLGLTAADNLKLLSELEKSAANGGWAVERAVARHFLSFEKFYAKQLSLEALYVNIIEEFEGMKAVGLDRFRDFDVPWLMYHDGRFMYQLEDFDKALQYLTAAEPFLRPTERGGQAFVLVLNHIQTIYQQSKDYEKGIEYARKILRFVQSPPTNEPKFGDFYRQWQGLSSIDIASMMVGQGRSAEGEAFAGEGYELARSNGQPDSLTAMSLEYAALLVLTSVKLELGKLAEAAPLMRRLDRLHEAVGGVYDNFSSNASYFERRARYEEMRGDLAASMRFARLARPLRDSLDRRNDARKLERLQQRLEAQKYTEKIRLVEREKELQKWLRNAAFAILALGLGLAYGWWHRQRHLRRQSEAELEAARAELAALTQNYREKSDMAAQLRLEVERLAATGERSQHIEQLLHSVILTDDDWLRFRAVFEKVHPGFVEEQRAQQPDLTQAELRYLVLEKLNLTTHEMAAMLGVNDNTVRQTRARLRRKTG